MSENQMPSLSEIREQYADATIEDLQNAYGETFGEAPYASGTETLTTDKELLIRKLSYSKLLQAYADAEEEIPSRLNTLANKAFDTPFEKTGSRASRDNTIQAYIVRRLWDCVQNGYTPTVEELGAEIVENFPESTYKKDPVGRMRVDINKFNKGLFPYGVTNEMVPSEDQRFVPGASETVEVPADEGDDS